MCQNTNFPAHEQKRESRIKMVRDSFFSDLSIFLLMSHFAKAFLPFMSRHFSPETLFTARHCFPFPVVIVMD
jgi:hypothetical protein